MPKPRAILVILKSKTFETNVYSSCFSEQLSIAVFIIIIILDKTIEFCSVDLQDQGQTLKFENSNILIRKYSKIAFKSRPQADRVLSTPRSQSNRLLTRFSNTMLERDSRSAVGKEHASVATGNNCKNGMHTVFFYYY